MAFKISDGVFRGGVAVRYAFIERYRTVPASDLAFAGSDATDIVGLTCHRIRVEIDQGLAHLAGVLLIHAKDDCLGVAIGLLEELGEVMRNRFRARAQRDDSLKILRLIFVVRDRPAITVKLVPAFRSRSGSLASPSPARSRAPQASRQPMSESLPVGPSSRKGRHANEENQ